MQHVNDKFYFRREKKNEKIPIQDIIEDNNIENNNNVTEGIIRMLENEIENKKKEIFRAIMQCKLFEDHLKKISFKFKEVDINEYFIVRIQKEEKEKKEGFLKRINILNELLKKSDEFKNLPPNPNMISIDELEAMEDNEDNQYFSSFFNIFQNILPF